jgi:hypothetical protein
MSCRYPGPFSQVRVLSDVNQLLFDAAAAGLKDHPATTEEIVSCCDDLKLLGKLDFKNLLKWRTAVLRDSRFAKPKVGNGRGGWELAGNGWVGGTVMG